MPAPTITDQDAALALDEFFTYENCAECLKGPESHTPIMLDFGPYGANWFFRCTTPEEA